MSDTVISPTAATADDNSPLSLAELVGVAQAWAPRVGKNAGSGQPKDRRWYCRLEHNEQFEVWLMGWDQAQATDFHDHGGSSGAVVVVAGGLSETRLREGKDVSHSQRLVKAGHTFAFGPEAVHDVSNADLGPSLSIHVYSPPLSTMTYYESVDGELVAKETIEVDGPEPDGVEVPSTL